MNSTRLLLSWVSIILIARTEPQACACFLSPLADSTSCYSSACKQSYYCHHYGRRHYYSRRILNASTQEDINYGRADHPIHRMEPPSSNQNIWNVYVSQSNNNNEKGIVSPSAIMQSFMALAPSSVNLQVFPASFHKQSKQKGKGPTVRCIEQRRGKDTVSQGVIAPGEIITAFEVTNVDSVDKVYRIITEHMKILGEKINPKAYECIQCYFEGNRCLDEGEPSQAIAFFQQALTASDGQPPTSLLPTGSILMQRSCAYRMRAANHRSILRTLVKELADDVPSASTLSILYNALSSHPVLSPSMHKRLAGDSKVQQAKFRQIRYRQDMYEFALLHAVQDSLQATQILPHDAQAWLLAGECLAELRKLNESNQYYERALEIDPRMEQSLRRAVEKNRRNQEFMDAVRTSGFSGDALRLAFDVAE